VAVGCGGAAVAVSGDDPAEAVGVDQVAATPVLSARRVPEVLAAPVADRRLGADLRSWLDGSPPDTCLVVTTAGRDAFEHNPALSVTGASTQKILTATALLRAYDPEHTFTTTASAAAPPQDGVVTGDLFLVGGGPADLGTTDWPEMAPGTRPRVVDDIDGLVDAIQAAGVVRIEGAVVGDDSRFDDRRYEPTVASRLIDQDQVGPIAGLMVNDGFAQFGPARTNAGTVPATDPAADAARVLTERLVARGITVVGPPRSGAAPADATTVATLDSPPVAQLVADMLTTSDNEAAEASIKEVGVATSGTGSWEAGAAGVTALLDEAGVPLEGVEIVDGSGLSIEGRFTCGALVDVLDLPDTGPVVRAGLAVAGETGTLADRFEGTEAAGRMRAKTGSLRNVTALAGEIEPLPGGELTFAYVANVPDPQEIDPEDVGFEELAQILVRYPRDIDLATLEPAAPVPAGG
jgi:D-alanyl-D-alanine carboxypeptidase/D-alanyl-D-alanine-endopeptidase (penicillin-binding protein 4)